MQGTRIDRYLNLVLPVDGTSLGTVYVFSTPVSYEVFERYYRVMARAWSLVAGMGGMASGPKVAAMELRQTAQDMGLWEGEAGVERGLLSEIRRLTNVVCPIDGGWEPLPLMDAVAAGALDSEDIRDIEGVVTFFTLASAVQSRKQLATTLGGLRALLDVQITSSDCSAWIASALNSKETVTGSPPPPKANERDAPAMIPPVAATEPGQGRVTSLPGY